jgi:hypothetical protein
MLGLMFFINIRFSFAYPWVKQRQCDSSDNGFNGSEIPVKQSRTSKKQFMPKSDGKNCGFGVFAQECKS